MQYVRISKVTKNLNFLYTGNYNIPGVIVDYRETRLMTTEHLENYRENKCLFTQAKINLIRYFLCLKKREDDTKSRNAGHKFIFYNIYMYIKKKKDRLGRNIMR